ncbi:XdhC family protein [Methylomicrobium lacus]|uniref:XdhC family protein n=1 Tax=Methylomicrobium lacus TaxID=136992 RepID=UPI0035A9118A
MANQLYTLVDNFRNLASDAADFVLATIISTQGSTYQKAGARMLIAPDGTCQGMLSGGCFESDLSERARSVFATGRAVTVDYDMRSPEEMIWGLGLGCNGAVKIFLQLLKAEEHDFPLDVLAQAVSNDRQGVLLTVIESTHHKLPAGRSLFLREEDGENDDSSWPDALIAAARRTLSGDRPHSENHLIEDKTVSVFYDPIRPLPRLLIVGAGTDAVPVLQCAKALGWRVTIVDHRPAYIKPERFASACRLFHCPPQHLAGNLQLDHFDAAVLMSHSFEYDSRFLKSIADSRIPFIGLLGPKARKERLLEGLGAQAAKLEGRVFGPVGLDIGARTPEEIALSIMAGILAAQNRRQGGQLTMDKVSAHA